MVTATRDFFLSRGYLETDTPALAPSLIPESCLEVFATEYVHPTKGTQAALSHSLARDMDEESDRGDGAERVPALQVMAQC